MTTLTRGQLARRCGIGPETIRFYERQGLLPEAPRSSSNYRRFGEAAVKRLQFIRRAKTLGFSLPEIRELLALQDEPGHDRAEVKRLTESRLREVESRIADLASLRSALQEMVEHCSGHGPIQGCPIIETLAGDATPAATPDGQTEHEQNG